MTVKALIFGIDVARITSEARAKPSGQQKLHYISSIAATIGVNPWIEIRSNDVLVYQTKLAIGESLAASAQGITLPLWFIEPPTTNLANALSTSTTYLFVRSATSSSIYIQVPMNTGGGGSPDIALDISKGLDSVWYVRTNSAVILVAPIDMDVNANPPDPEDWNPRISIDQLMTDMLTTSSVQPRFGTSNNANPETAGANYENIKCLVDRGPVLPVKAYEYTDEALPWFWPYAGPGHVDGKGLRLQYGHGIISVRRKSNGVWVDHVRNNHFDGYTFYGNAWQATLWSTLNDIRDHPDGSRSSQFLGNAGPELWIPAIHSRELMVDCRVLAVICMCRIIDNNNNPYYGNEGCYAVHIGVDCWGRNAPGGNTQTFGGSDKYWGKQTNGPNSRWIPVRNGDWQPCALIGMDRGHGVSWNAHGWIQEGAAINCFNSPYVDTQAQIRANPPTWTY